MSLIIRPYTTADQSHINTLSWPSLSDRHQLFGCTSTNLVFQSAFLALVVIDPSSTPHRIIGCATFNNTLPETLSIYPETHSYLQRKLSVGKPTGCLLLSYFSQYSNVSHAWIVTELFQYVFHTCKTVGGIVLPVPTGIDLQEIGLFDHTFSCYDPVSVHTGALFRFYRTIRMDISPCVRIRSVQSFDLRSIQSLLVSSGHSPSRIAHSLQERQHKNIIMHSLHSKRPKIHGFLSCSDLIPSEYACLFSQLYQQRTIREMKIKEAKPLQMIMIGPTGSGKTTQCQLLVEEFGIIRIELNELIQQHLKKKGKQEISEEMILDMILERIGDEDCIKNGWILDGFPQTEVQARVLINHRIIPDLVVVMDIAEQVVLKRLCPRRMDVETGYLYHLDIHPPPPEISIERLVQASEDRENVVKARLQTYSQQVDVQAFMKLTKMTHIDAARTRDSIMKKILRDVYDAKKRRRPLQVRHAPRLVIIGPPGSGKRTQCESIITSFHVIHLSTGDMLRSAIQDYTSELGRQAKIYVEAGILVPDSLMIDLILTRLEQRDCIQNGWLLDGFPRTQEQAIAMIAKGIVPDVIFILKVPDQVIIERLSGRIMDPETGTTYHKTINPPPEGEIALRCKQRSDDSVETIRIRLQTYHDHCDQVQQAFMTHSCCIKEVEGTLDISTISRQLSSTIEQILLQKNCFMIDLYTLQPEYECRIQHLLVYAFQIFPDKDCIIYATPKGKAPISIINGFQAIESNFIVLYVLHRHELPFLNDQPLVEAMETRIEKTREQVVIIKSGFLGRLRLWLGL